MHKPPVLLGFKVEGFHSLGGLSPVVTRAGGGLDVNCSFSCLRGKGIVGTLSVGFILCKTHPAEWESTCFIYLFEEIKFVSSINYKVCILISCLPIQSIYFIGYMNSEQISTLHT